MCFVRNVHPRPCCRCPLKISVRSSKSLSNPKSVFLLIIATVASGVHAHSHGPSNIGKVPVSLDSCVASTADCSRFIQHGILVLRGGADQQKEDSETIDLDEGHPPAKNDDESFRNDLRSGSFSPLHLLPSLFQLGNDVKSDASLEAEGDGLSSPYTSSALSNSMKSSGTSPHNDGRGGAMVKTKPPPRRILHWLAPLETDRVAPLSERLLVDEKSKVAEETSREQPESDFRSGSEARSSRSIPVTGSPLPVRREENKETKKVKADGTRGAEHRVDSRPVDSREDEEAVSGTNATLSGSSREDPATSLLLVSLQNATESDASIAESPFVSSGYWSSIDKTLTFGYSDTHPAWRLSRHLRAARKMSARITGLHGALSGKLVVASDAFPGDTDERQMGIVRRRIAAIARARENVDRITAEETSSAGSGFWPWRRKESEIQEFTMVLKKKPEDVIEEQKRKERVRQIDKLIAESQKRLQDLACEKDVLQRRPNPLWNYTTDQRTVATSSELVSTSRKFSFPPPDLVEEYLDIMFSSGKLIKLNHTDLWRNNVDFDEDDDDDELTDADSSGRKGRSGNGGSGNWLLRYGLGEKIGEAAETAAYKSVCAAIMSVLARGLSSLHGVNVMAYSDIRLFMEQAPDLPPFAAGIIPGSGLSSNYAQGAIEQAMRKSAKRRKKRKQAKDPFREDSFIQRDAVVETLLSHCQISAPLLKLFPIGWQRAMLSNIITLITSIIADFFEGLEFQILGYRLSFAFTPITESDMLRRLSSVGEGVFRHRSSSPEQFEAAVRATANDLAEELKFLDRWHERALGSGLLRMQIANLIARLVLTLADDVLSGARMDLWASHAGGPRLVAGLEYRTTPNYMDEETMVFAPSPKN